MSVNTEYFNPYIIAIDSLGVREKGIVVEYPGADEHVTEVFLSKLYIYHTIQIS